MRRATAQKVTAEKKWKDADLKIFWIELKKEAQKVLAARRQLEVQEKTRRAAFGALTARQTSKEEDGNDGTLDCKDFERIIIMSGLTWMGSNEMKELFAFLSDGKPKMTFKDVRKTCFRVLYLLERVEAHAESALKLGNPMSYKEAYETFCKLLLIGQDLLNTFPSTVATFPKTREPHLHPRLGRLHGPHQEGTCWKPDKSKEYWIQWTFPTKMQVTAVKISGCCWHCSHSGKHCIHKGNHKKEADTGQPAHEEEYVTVFRLDYTDKHENEAFDKGKKDEMRMKIGEWQTIENVPTGLTSRDGDQDIILKEFIETPVIGVTFRLSPTEWHMMGTLAPGLQVALYGYKAL